MNEQPELDFSYECLVCMKDGKFMNRQDDGESTWLNWVDNPNRANVFWPIYPYGVNLNQGKPEFINLPEYYQKWPAIPAGAKMVLVKMNTTVWIKEVGPTQP